MLSSLASARTIVSLMFSMMSLMSSPDLDRSTTISLGDIQRGRIVQQNSGDVYRTPLILLPNASLGVPPTVMLYGKMENMQNFRSFKVRGVVTSVANAPKELQDGKLVPFTFSCGNYALAFSHVLSRRGIHGIVIMPDNALARRVEEVRSFGMETILVPLKAAKATVASLSKQEGMICLDSFNSKHSIAGNGSVGLEILEDCSDVDVVVVCCGGGGLLAGVSAAIKQTQEKASANGHSTRVVGVEPEGAPIMYLSLREGKPVSNGNVKSVAEGLSPPYVGEIGFRHVQRYVDEVVLVSDAEIIEAARALHNVGILVEPSGAAALAAVKAGKIGGIAGKKVAITLTGSNITPKEVYDQLTVQPPA